MKFVAKKDHKNQKFVRLFSEYEKEVKILDKIKKENIEDIIAKPIYFDEKNVCIWMELG